jgi:hypothetical protein
MALSSFAGQFSAREFSYAPIMVTGGSDEKGTYAITLGQSYAVLDDGTVLRNVFSTDAPVTVGAGPNLETVTPTAAGNGVLTAKFEYPHGNGDLVRSGTFGLAEAANYAASMGGGKVVVDPQWTLLGGTDDLLGKVKMPQGVSVVDDRSKTPPPPAAKQQAHKDAGTK